MFDLKSGQNLWRFFEAHVLSPVKGSGVVGDVFMKYHLYDDTLPLVITFSNAGEITRTTDLSDKVYSPWGFSFVDSYDVNVLSFSCFNKVNWYRSPEFHNFLKLLSPLLSIFNTKIGYGGSMGGHAISTFANCLGLKRQLLMNPISSLSSELVSWETRFSEDKKLDWAGDFVDGADCLSKSIIVYDPLFKLDALHVRRYKNSILLKLPGVGHGIPKHLNNLGLLKFVFEMFLFDKIEAVSFHKLVRSRRYYNGYYKWMLSQSNTHLTPSRQKIIREFRNRIPKKEIPKVPGFQESDVDLMRDLAIKLEGINMEESYKLMLIAHRLRPQGKLIAKKILIYKTRLGLSSDY